MFDLTVCDKPNQDKQTSNAFETLLVIEQLFSWYVMLTGLCILLHIPVVLQCPVPQVPMYATCAATTGPYR